VICFDADFPALTRQGGQAGIDILLRPAHEWQEIDPLHAQIAVFRAIENGFSLVSQAELGRSIAVDYEGHVLASSDYFTSDAQVMVAYIPTKGVSTIYAAIGDLFAWLCIAGLVIFMGMAVVQRRQQQSMSDKLFPDQNGFSKKKFRDTSCRGKSEEKA
jgi:apolipoprotein N-acyltransferase